MLFTVKHDAVRSLGLAVVFTIVAVLAHRALGIDWSLAFGAPVVLSVLLGLLAIGLSDALVHGVLRSAFGDAYRRTFRGLVEYFETQSTWGILAGGVLAGAEELLFRGVVLLGLVQLASAPAWLAVVAAALLFGSAHYVPTRELRPMVLWATLEGVVLGGLLVATGSLLVPVVVHALHDVVGFGLFAWLRQRRS